MLGGSSATAGRCAARCSLGRAAATALLACFSAFASAALGETVASAAEPAAPGAELTSLRGALEFIVNERGQQCSLQAVRETATRTKLAACGAAGLWELELREGASPRLLQSYDLNGEVLGFFEEPDGQVWVKVQTLQARALNTILPRLAPKLAAEGVVGALPTASEPVRASSQPAPVQAAPASTRAPALGSRGATGKVVSVSSDDVIISLGSRDGIAPGDHVEFSTERRLQLAPGEVAVSRESLAVGVVTNVSSDHASVRLGLNERVPLGAIATKTSLALTQDHRGIPRLGGSWHANVVLRPFFALEELGGGFLLNAAVGYRFFRNFHVSAELDPLAMGDAERRRGVTAFNVVLMGSYDSRLVELGVGVGAQSVNSVDFDLEVGSGLGFTQLLRLGSVDGGNVTARSNIVLFHSEFNFSALTITAQLPVAENYWLIGGGGGGTIGSAYGELGVRVLLNGRGGRGSTFFSATAGAAAVFSDGGCSASEFGFVCGDEQTYAGPMAGVGVEHRF